MLKILRKCNSCKIQATTQKELELFAPDRTQPHGRKNKCKECRKTQRRNNGLMSAYGITLEEYDELLVLQEGICKICGTDTPGHKGRFHVDHNHKTGKIRGLLCHACNTGIGLLKDSTEILAKAIIYLEEEGSYGSE